ncbi:PIN domain-containing protein [Limnohabitans sp. Rim8]|jgi:predicted nucleic acid-binding protein|uniref:type II toxin-antitoxin system VapC family toxin n=1 Tax=Limnohabitans sp. Rim8 TaxID=1100718 RepID=UPI002621226C|nr:PIN domain-containing protein [Limnohabitans sp. Rim8]
MKVLVDTSVWSLALRRPKNVALSPEQKTVVTALADLMQDGRAVMMGAIRQELLSGIKTQAGFDALKSTLSAFEDVPLTMTDYEKAAQVFNTCRTNGVQGSNTDFLICAVSINHKLPIFSIDNDFLNYQKCLPVLLYSLQIK